MKRSTKGISSVLAIAFVFGLLTSAPATVSAQALAEQVSRQVTEDLNLTREIIQIKRLSLIHI